MNGVAIYARYSSDQQREASIEDQVRLCKERAHHEGWRVAGVYTDHAISGASLMRPGIQQLLQDALAGRFEIIFAEAMDRLSRDQADIAGIYKRLRFAGVMMVTMSEGEIGDLHIGLKGTMNEGTGRKKTLTIDLKGHLAGILALGAAAKKIKGATGAPDLEKQIKVVAGAGFEPATFRL